MIELTEAELLVLTYAQTLMRFCNLSTVHVYTHSGYIVDVPRSDEPTPKPPQET